MELSIYSLDCPGLPFMNDPNKCFQLVHRVGGSLTVADGGEVLKMTKNVLT